MIEQIETHPTILNKENLEIRAAFFAPCSDAPDMNLGEYSRTLDKLQRDAKTLRMNISDEDKTTNFVGCAQHSKMFEEKWTQKWEATINRGWTVVYDIWVNKYGEVTHATMMAEKRSGYKSDAALRSGRAPAPRPLPPAPRTPSSS